MFNLNVRFHSDNPANNWAHWQVWREKGEIRCGLSSGYCYPWGFTADELGAVIKELYSQCGSQIAHVQVTPAVE